MGSITASNAKIYLSVAGVFDTPQPLQGFSADDIFDTNDIQPTETIMGVDGKLSAGKIFVPLIQNIVLQADSVSNDVFDQWAAAMEKLGDVYWAGGTTLLTSISREYTLVNGSLTGYKKVPDARRVLQPRRYQITWEAVGVGRVQF